MQKHELIDKSSPIPAYHQIINDMMDRITHNEWEMNAKLPSEPALAEEYSVSRVTIRQAMAELESRHILVRHQGKGAFLVGRPMPFMEDLNLPSLEHQKDPKSRSISTIIELIMDPEPPQYVKDVFANESARSPFIYLCRIFSKNGYPIGLHQAWFPSSLVPQLAEQGLINASVSTTLRERYGFDVSRVENTIEATKANAAEASLLKVPYDSSLLRILSVNYTNNNILIELSNTLWVGDMIRFKFTAK